MLLLKNSFVKLRFSALTEEAWSILVTFETVKDCSLYWMASVVSFNLSLKRENSLILLYYYSNNTNNAK